MKGFPGVDYRVEKMFEMLDKFLTISQLNFSQTSGIKMLKKPVDKIKLSNMNDVDFYIDNNVIST